MAKKKAAARPWAERMKHLRASQGLSQERMAKRVGVSTATWIAWENNLRRPSNITRRLISLMFPKS